MKKVISAKVPETLFNKLESMRAEKEKYTGIPINISQIIIYLLNKGLANQETK